MFRFVNQLRLSPVSYRKSASLHGRISIPEGSVTCTRAVEVVVDVLLTSYSYFTCLQPPWQVCQKSEAYCGNIRSLRSSCYSIDQNDNTTAELIGLRDDR